jgi:RHS repeat-associated protein
MIASVRSIDGIDRHTAYEYWPDGTLAEKRESSGDARTYVYGAGVEMLSETYAFGGAVETTDYIWCMGKLVGRVTARNPGTEEVATDCAYYLTDQIGSVVAALDANANVLYTDEFDAFGAPSTYGAKPEIARFTGKHYDADVGLYYYNARWYDPAQGRFTTEDPIRDGQNWYAYCGNNPMTYTDPTGLLSPEEEYEQAMELGNEVYGSSTSSQSGSEAKEEVDTRTTPQREYEEACEDAIEQKILEELELKKSIEEKEALLQKGGIILKKDETITNDEYYDALCELEKLMNSVTECGERFRWLQGQADQFVFIVIGRDIGGSKAKVMSFDGSALDGSGASSDVIIDLNDIGKSDGGVTFDSVGEIAAHEISGHAYLTVRGLQPSDKVSREREAVAMQNEYRSVVDHQIAQRAYYTFSTEEIKSMPTFVDGAWISYFSGFRTPFIPIALLTESRR